jgi:hypothetical protein
MGMDWSRFATSWFNLRRKTKPKERKRREAYFSFVINLILAVVFGIVPMPVAIRWSLWLVCLVAACIIVAIHDPVDRLPSRTRFMGALLVVAFFVVLFYGMATMQWRAEQAAMSTGTLRATASLDFKGVNPGAYCMLIGFATNAGAICVDPNKATGFLSALGDDVSMKTVEGEATLDATMRNSGGYVIVEVINNHWRVAQASTLVWDKNYRDDMLEVLDGKRQVVLSLKLFTDGIRIELDSHNEYRQDIRLYEDADGSGRVEVYNPGVLIPRNNIEAQFKYPSSKYWRELRDSGTPPS